MMPGYRLPVMTDDEAGRIAYTAYCNTVGWKSAVSGDPLPQWDDQADVIKQAWIAAAYAVRESTRTA